MRAFNRCGKKDVCLVNAFELLLMMIAKKALTNKRFFF